jgi:glycosyltransferase involved in cell wall biosynthesis
MIAEGSYPYVAGGVSSWIQQIIKAFPNDEFKVVSIMPSKKETVELKYELPDNVINLKTIYLDDYLNIKHKSIPKNPHLSKFEKRELSKFIRFQRDIDWFFIISFFSNKKRVGTAIDFLQSYNFWKETLDFYNSEFEDEVFNQFFWTLRNMLLPLIYLIQQDAVEADIYHSASTGYSGILSTAFSINTTKPYLLSEHGIYAREREEELLKAKWVQGIYKKFWIDFFYSISIASYKQASIVTSLFNSNREIQISLGVPDRKALVTPNGINYKKLNIERVEHKGINIGAILRVVPIKDIMTLIRAFSIVKRKTKDVKLYIIGPAEEDPAYYEQCLNLVKLLEVEEDVIFTGRVDIKEYLGIIDIMILTSISEGQPLVILEGWAARIPFISTDVGSCRDMLTGDEFEGDCGIITKLASPSDTANALLTLIASTELRHEMGDNGRRRVERLYNDDVLVESYRKIYETLYKRSN